MAALHIFVRFARNGFVEIWVERLSRRFDTRHTFVFQNRLELACDQFHAIAPRIPFGAVCQGTLQVIKVNPARRLYERLGFRAIGETETNYQMQGNHREAQS